MSIFKRLFRASTQSGPGLDPACTNDQFRAGLFKNSWFQSLTPLQQVKLRDHVDAALHENSNQSQEKALRAALNYTYRESGEAMVKHDSQFARVIIDTSRIIAASMSDVEVAETLQRWNALRMTGDMMRKHYAQRDISAGLENMR